ncbi:MAG: WG repeat-containing protein [Bacteroidetes bacterium]|nr:MAG: WG repeat-containing protein [Bacteroidota bacterium]
MRKLFTPLLFLFFTASLVAQVPGANEPTYPVYPNYGYDYDEEVDEEEYAIESVEIDAAPERYERVEYVNSPYRNYDRQNRWTYYYENGKQGLKVNGEKVTQPIYDRVIACYPHSFIVGQNNLYGLVDSTGKVILELQFEFMMQLNQELIQVRQDKKEGLYHADGTKVLPLKYLNVFGVNSAGQVAVQDKKHKLHLLNLKGKTIQKNVDNIQLFRNGAVVKKDDQYALFVKGGHSDFEYDSIYQTGNYSRNNRYSRNRYSSKRSSSYQTKPAPRFHAYIRENITTLTVEKESKLGLIDSNLKLVVPIEFDEIIRQRYHSYVDLQKGELHGFYLINLGVYQAATYSSVTYMSNRFLQIKDGQKVGIVSLNTGKTIVPPYYYHVNDVDNLFIVKDRMKSGIIDTSGNVVLEPSYDRIYKLNYGRKKDEDQLFSISDGKQYGVFSLEHGLILKPSYDNISMLNNRYIVTGVGNLHGLYTLDGKQLLAEEFRFITAGKAQYGARYPKLIIAYKDSLTLLLDSAGNNILKEKIIDYSVVKNDKGIRLYSRSYNSNDFMLIVTEKGKSGILNTELGEMVIPAEYDEISMMIENGANHDTYFVVKKNGKYGVVNQQHKIQIEPRFDALQLYGNETYVRQFNGQIIPVMTFVGKLGNRYGLVNTKDSIVLPFTYSELTKLGVNTYKAKFGNHYKLIDASGKVLNAGPFDEITQFEYLSRYDARKWLIKNNSRVALTFYQGQMREISESGQFLTEAVAMKPHQGFQSIDELKLALKNALNSADDADLKDFAKKICISDHLLHWMKPFIEKERRSKKQADFEYLSIEAQYYDELVRFKRFEWNSPKFDRSLLDEKEFANAEDGVYTNRRMSGRSYGESETLNHILKDCIKINGYWISSYFLRLYNY